MLLSKRADEDCCGEGREGGVSCYGRWYVASWVWEFG